MGSRIFFGLLLLLVPIRITSGCSSSSTPEVTVVNEQRVASDGNTRLAEWHYSPESWSLVVACVIAVIILLALLRCCIIRLCPGLRLATLPRAPAYWNPAQSIAGPGLGSGNAFPLTPRRGVFPPPGQPPLPEALQYYPSAPAPPVSASADPAAAAATALYARQMGSSQYR